MRIFLLNILAITLLAVGAAASARASENSLLGTGIGAAIGGLFGSQFSHGGGQVAATCTGIVVGGLIGNNIGHTLDAENENYSENSRHYVVDNAPQPISYATYAPNYVAPPSPPPIYIDDDEGTYCRPYSHVIRNGGQLKESYGTACLQSDGSWRVTQ